MSDSAQKLSIGTKLGYGICDLGGNLFFTVTAFVLLNFLTDVVGLEAGLAGTVLMIGRIWDAFYDPIIGFFSDRTHSKMGRRRPYMLAGAIPLFLAMGLMFFNPSLVLGSFSPAEHQTMLFLWGLVVYILLCTAYSTVNIPYSSLTPELTQNFHERTSLNGFRFAFAALGTMLGAGITLPFIGSFADKNTGFAAMGIVFGGVMMATTLTTVISVREPPKTHAADRMDFIHTYVQVFRNRPYVLILAAYCLNIIAITIVSGVMIYYFKYIHHSEEKTTIALASLIGVAMLFIPVSVMIAKKFGKKIVYGTGLLILAAGTMTLFLFGHTQPVEFTFAVMVVSGIGMGFTYAMPFAIVPDSIEYDYLVTGERREGAFYGIWTWALKIGQALAVFLMGWILSLSGYLPGAEQIESAKFGIRLFLGPVPAFVFVASAVVLYFYPINEKRYAEILDEIEKRNAKNPT